MTVGNNRPAREGQREVFYKMMTSDSDLMANREMTRAITSVTQVLVCSLASRPAL